MKSLHRRHMTISATSRLLLLCALCLVSAVAYTNAERDFNFNDTQVPLLEPKDEPAHTHHSQDPYAVELSHCHSADSEIVLSLVLKNHDWHDLNDNKKAKLLEKLSKFFAIPKEFLIMESVSKRELSEMQKESIRKGNNKCHSNINSNNRRLGRVSFVLGCGANFFTMSEPITKQIGAQMKDGSIDNITGQKFGWWIIWRKQFKTRAQRNRRDIEGSGGDDADDDYDYEYGDEEEDAVETVTEVPAVTTHAHRHHHGVAQPDLIENELELSPNNRVATVAEAEVEAEENVAAAVSSSQANLATDDTNLLLSSKNGNIDEEIVESVSQLESVITKTIENTKNIKELPVGNEKEEDVPVAVEIVKEELDKELEQSSNLNVNEYTFTTTSSSGAATAGTTATAAANKHLNLYANADDNYDVDADADDTDVDADIDARNEIENVEGVAGANNALEPNEPLMRNPKIHNNQRVHEPSVNSLASAQLPTASTAASVAVAAEVIESSSANVAAATLSPLAVATVSDVLPHSTTASVVATKEASLPPVLDRFLVNASTTTATTLPTLLLLAPTQQAPHATDVPTLSSSPTAFASATSPSYASSSTSTSLSSFISSSTTTTTSSLSSSPSSSSSALPSISTLATPTATATSVTITLSTKQQEAAAAAAAAAQPAQQNQHQFEQRRQQQQKSSNTDDIGSVQLNSLEDDNANAVDNASINNVTANTLNVITTAIITTSATTTQSAQNENDAVEVATTATLSSTTTTTHADGQVNNGHNSKKDDYDYTEEPASNSQDGNSVNSTTPTTPQVMDVYGNAATTPSTSATSPTSTAGSTPSTTSTEPTTPTVASTDYVEPKVENSPPMIRTRLQKFAVTSGKAFSFVIPRDTFYDNEDLNNVRLELTDKGGHELKPSSWLQFNSETHVLYGLPLDDAVSKWQYCLSATDSGNESVTETLEMSVQQHRGVRTVNHEISITVKVNEKSIPSIDWQLKLIRAIASTLGDENTNWIVVREVRQMPQDANTATFVYFNETLPTSECPEYELNKLVKRLDASRLSDLVYPTLGVKSITGQLIGACQKAHITKPIPTTHVMTNLPPMPRNQVDRVNATVGHLLVFKVPSDTFYDPNDNELLTLSLKTKEHKDLNPRHWLQFDSKNQEFYGIPKSGDYGSEEYLLVAEDAGGLSATDALVVVVNHAPKKEFSVYFKAYLAIRHEQFNADLQRKFVERIAQLFGDASTQNVQIRSVTTHHDSDGTIVNFYNTTLYKSHNRCPEEEIEAVRCVFLIKDYMVRDNVKKVLGPELNLTNMQAIPLGLCHPQTDVIHREFVPTKTEEPTLKSSFSEEYMYTIILPAVIIVSMILIASLIACCLYRRRRKSGKMELGDEEERKSFRTKGIPVIFQDELDEKPEIGNKSPIILKDEKPPLLPPSYNTSNMNGDNDVDEYLPPPAVVVGGREARGKSPATPSYRKPPPYVSP